MKLNRTLVVLALLSATKAMSIEDESTHEKILEKPDAVKNVLKESEIPPEEEYNEDDDGIDLENDLDLDDLDDDIEDNFEDLLDMPDDDDFVEEETKADGSHVRKEVTKGENGGKTIRITSKDGAGMPPGMVGGPPSGLMEMIMQDMLKDMMGGGPPGVGGIPGGGTVRITSGPMPGGDGTMTIRRTIRTSIPPPHLEDDDDEGIPPEILEMMRMTDMMS